MKNIRSYVLCLMLLGMVAVVSGCGDGRNNTNSQSSAASTRAAETESAGGGMAGRPTDQDGVDSYPNETGRDTEESTGVLEGIADDLGEGAEDIKDGVEDMVDGTNAADESTEAR